MVKINIPQLVVDNYDINEIIESLNNNLQEVCVGLNKAVEANNMGSVGAWVTNVMTIYSIVHCLNEKLNGKKEATVVQ